MVSSFDRFPRKRGRRAGGWRPRLQRKHRIFLAINGIVLGCTAVAVLTNPYASASTAAYVVLLSITCTLPLLFASHYGGRASLLIIFLAYYFATFGLGSFVSLFAYQPVAPAYGGVTSSWGGSIAILVGAVCFLAGYGVTTGLPIYRAGGWSAREWAPQVTAVVGSACWAIGWLSTVSLQFGAADPNSGQHINPMIGGFLALIRLLEPVGTLLLIYLYVTARSRKILALIIAIMVLDALLGFFGGSKQIAMRTPVLFVLSFVLLRERIPVLFLVVFTLITGLFFNAFQNYRNELSTLGQTRTSAVAQISAGKNSLLHTDTSLGKRLSGGFDYFLLRISQKPIMDIIVARTGKDGIKFQDGATLAPLLYIFIPRLIAPNKPNNITGLLFNHTFSLSTANTFVGSTNLGDLYWNFGWTGILVGMTIIGAFMAWAATKFRLDNTQTLPKFLFLVVTIYFAVLKSGGGVALTYTLWARVAVLLLLIHVFAPKVRVPRRRRVTSPEPGAVTAADAAITGPGSRPR